MLYSGVAAAWLCGGAGVAGTTNSTQIAYFVPGPISGGHSTNRIVPVISRPASPAQLAPGVYETKPYTCIVVVPGVHPDDKMSKGGPSVAPSEPWMPAVKPDLHFVPRTSPAK
jgi:hypothetical protein